MILDLSDLNLKSDILFSVKDMFHPKLGLHPSCRLIER